MDSSDDEEEPEVMADLLTDQNGFRRRLNDDHDESNDQDASKRAKRSPSTSSSCSSSSSASSSSSSDSSIGATREETFVSTLFPPEPPKFASSLTHQIRRRQIALRKQSQLKRHFHKQAAARFRLEKVLPGHAGCVNALGWSTNGQMIVSGSDDTRLCIHAPFSAQKTPLAQIDTDHQMNIFQSKFVPYTNDRMIVSASRDGLVSLTQLDQTGQLVRFDADHCGNAIIQHSQACHKLCFVPGTQTILTCGEDGNVFRYDPRESVSSSTGRGLRPFLKYKSPQHERHGGTEHNAIDFNKSGSHHFALGGRYHAALVYDYRVVKDATQSQYTEPIAEIAPEHIFRMRRKFECPHITALRYSNSGDKLLMSYNDENIHLYDIKEDRFEHAFEGHRNHQTVKGVNFYGQHSEFVISGSDCGNLYIWDAKTGELINWQFADGDAQTDPGILNVLEPHPTLPFLATSGLDTTVKLWSPTGMPFTEQGDHKSEAKRRAVSNRRSRLESRSTRSRVPPFHQLMHYIANVRRFEHGDDEEANDSEQDSDEEEVPECRPQ